MESWARKGPVVVEVDGSAEGRRVVEYACREAMRSGSGLLLAAPYQPYSLLPVSGEWQSPADLLRTAVAQIRYLAGSHLQLDSVAVEGSRLKALAKVARDARVLVVGRTPVRRPQRLVTAHGDIFLTARTGCPVIVVPATWRTSELDRQVAVGIDGTPLSLDAVEFAFRTAADRDGGLTVVHAQHAPRHGRDLSSTDELSVSETLADWAQRFPEVKVTRFLTGRPVVEALVQEGRQVGLVVVGAPAGLLPIGDPVVRRTVAGMSCPVAVVPHQAVDERAETAHPFDQSLENHV
jgi:nucleotide-binding universal stress UspA family protein